MKAPVVVALMGVLIAGCSAAPPAQEPVTGTGGEGTGGTGGTPGGPGGAPMAALTIEVRRGPLGPVELVGQEENTPVEDAAISVRDQLDREVASARSDAAGLARVTLAAGEYRVRLLSCPGARVPEPAPVSLQPGGLVTLKLRCDTEIQ